MMSLHAEAILPKPWKHGGFELKEFLGGKLRKAGYKVTDFGNRPLPTELATAGTKK